MGPHKESPAHPTEIFRLVNQAQGGVTELPRFSRKQGSAYTTGRTREIVFTRGPPKFSFCEAPQKLALCGVKIPHLWISPALLGV